MKLRLAKNIELDAQQAGTQTYGWIARKGGGKSYGASKLAELLHGAGVPLIVIDPVGIWWGLRLGADGVSPGLSIPVIGGQHGDIELPPDEGLGERLATWLIGTNGSAVIDVSEMRKAERKRFVAEFAEALFHAAKGKRRPRMVILEEAQIFAPQMAKGQERMLGAIEDIVRLGRNYGIGAMLVSQRPQSVNKEVLNQVECLFVGQLPAKHERDAIRGWVVAKGDTKGEAFLGKLPSLNVGDFFCWSPQWLKCLEQIRVLPKQTFDASSTPTLDSAGAFEGPQELGAIDLDALRALLTPEPAPEPAKRSKANGTSDHTAELAAALARAQQLEVERETIRRKIDNALAASRAAVNEMQSAVRCLLELVGGAEVEPAIAPSATRVEPRPPPAARAPRPDGTRLGKSEAAILGALLHRGSMSPVRLALLAGYKHSGGGFRNTLSALRTSGLIMGSNPISLTLVGQNRAKGLPKPMTGQQLQEFWGRKVGACGRSVLNVLAHTRGELPRSRVAAQTNYEETGGGFRNSLSALRTLGLIEGSERLAIGLEIRGDLGQ